jgi:transposase
MILPVAYVVRCPLCREDAPISILHAGKFWLADSRWECPNCGETSDREDMREVAAGCGPTEKGEG